jgi:hypothetical protein
MTRNLESWKTHQKKMFAINKNVEYIYVNEESFNIVFDKNMKELNFYIFKDDINNRQDLIAEFFNVSKIKEIHSRLNDNLYRELYSKLTKYIDIPNKSI